MSTGIKIKLVIVLFGLLLLLTSLTDPTRLPVPLLIAPFVLLFVLLMLLAQIFLDKLKRKNLRTTLLIAGLPVLLLAMQSVGQLTIRDFLTLVVLFSIGYLYLHRTSRSLG